MKGLRMRSVKLFLFLSVLFVFLFVSPVFSSDWVEYAKSQDGTILLYDKDSINPTFFDSIIQVWIRKNYSNESRNEEIQSRKKDRLPIIGWEKLSYDYHLLEIKCKGKEYNLLSFIFYDTDGNVLVSGKYKKTKWDYIVPDTMMDILHSRVCINQKH